MIARETEGEAPAPDRRMIDLQRRLHWICRGMEISAVSLAIWWVAASIWPWRHPAALVARIATNYGIASKSVTPTGYLLAFLIHLLATLLVAALMAAIFSLARGFRRGEFFDFSAARRLRRVAVTGLAMTVAGVVQRPLAYALVWPELFGHAPILTPRDVLLFFFSAFVFALAAVFRAAADVAHEHRAFV